MVFAETGAAVETVIVDGRVVLQNGRVTGVSEATLRDRAQASVERLSTANRELLQATAELSPYIVTHCQAMVAGRAPSEAHERGLGLGEAAI
jgi:hypothetical protein